jgi:hypothetical protein
MWDLGLVHRRTESARAGEVLHRWPRYSRNRFSGIRDRCLIASFGRLRTAGDMGNRQLLQEQEQ